MPDPNLRNWVFYEPGNIHIQMRLFRQDCRKSMRYWSELRPCLEQDEEKGQAMMTGVDGKHTEVFYSNPVAIRRRGWRKCRGVVKACEELCTYQLQALGYPPPPPPPWDHGGFDRFALPGVGNLTMRCIPGVGHLDRRQSVLSSSCAPQPDSLDQVVQTYQTFPVGLFDHVLCLRGRVFK